MRLQRKASRMSSRQISVTVLDCCSQTGAYRGQTATWEKVLESCPQMKHCIHMWPNIMIRYWIQRQVICVFWEKGFFGQIRLRNNYLGIPLGKLKALRSPAVIFLTQVSWLYEEILFLPTPINILWKTLTFHWVWLGGHDVAGLCWMMAEDIGILPLPEFLSQSSRESH